YTLANFLYPESSETASLEPNPFPDFCCPGTDCSYSKPFDWPCYCSTQPKQGLSGAFCSDPLAGCVSYEIQWTQCGDGYCGDMKYVPCGVPTPTPTPSISPTPPPVCDESTRPNPSCLCVTDPFGNHKWICYCS